MRPRSCWVIRCHSDARLAKRQRLAAASNQQKRAMTPERWKQVVSGLDNLRANVRFTDLLQSMDLPQWDRFDSR
jgi:hypothetical protein